MATAAGFPMEKERHRIIAIIAFDGDPLIDTADANKHLFLDPLWCANRSCHILGKGRISKTQSRNRDLPRKKPL
jgi:hypothetical protein